MQVAGRNLHRLVYLINASALLIAVTAASAEDMPQMQHHQADSASQERSCNAAIPGSAFLEGFESVQVETSDITRYEQFFESSCTRRLSRAWIIHKWTVSVAIVTEAS